MATEASGSSPTADSYIGSFISVTSKFEIRYEGVLYYLNPQDSTIGLKNVRSFGTEGRKNDGPQVPPSDKIYEYILFRGSDIKDLKVITSPPAQKAETIYDDPAIIQTNYNVGHSSSLESVSVGSGPSQEINLYGKPSEMNAKSYPSVSPSHHSGSQLGQWYSSQSTDRVISSSGIPMQSQRCGGEPASIPSAHQRSLSLTTTLYPLQNQESVTATNLSNNVSPQHSFAPSRSVYLNGTPNLASDQLSAPFTDSISSESIFPLHHSTLTSSYGLSMPFSLNGNNTSSIKALVDDNIVTHHVPSHPAQLAYSVSSVSTTSGPLCRQQPTLLTPAHLSQIGLSEYSPEKSYYPDQKDVDIMGSAPSNYLSSATIPAVQPPLLPLPPPTAKLQHYSQFTEEFDFQAMNEKFKKDEVWGHLGKAKGRDQIDGTSRQDSGDNNSSEAKPAYNKDDFFDTISCNSVGRGDRNGQNRFYERNRWESETFGRFRQKPQFGYGHGGGHGEHHGSYNWGRGYNSGYGNRGRGVYRQ